jgi:hypothetical protein
MCGVECNAMLNKRDEPITSNAISLSAAFRRFIEHRFENLRDLEREAEKSLRSVGTHELDADTGEWRRSLRPSIDQAVRALEKEKLIRHLSVRRALP